MYSGKYSRKGSHPIQQLWAGWGSKVAIGGKCKTSYFLFMASYPQTHTRGSRRSDFESHLLAELENLVLGAPESCIIKLKIQLFIGVDHIVGSVTPNS